MTTLAEDLVLLLISPRTGRIVVDAMALDRGVAGSLLLDLALRERLAVEGWGRRVRLSVINPAPTGEPIVDIALAELGRDPLRAPRAVERLGRRTREPVLDRLEQRNLARRHRRLVLGVFPTTRWEVLDEVTRERLRDRVERVLLHDQPPDVRLACLISLLYAVRAEHLVVDGPARRVRAAAARIAEDGSIGSSSRGSVAAVRSAVVPAAHRDSQTT